MLMLLQVVVGARNLRNQFGIPLVSVEIAKAVLQKFLGSDQSNVLALTGAWGVGKTHVWNESLEAHRDSIKREKYSYVSLFGLRSLGELRTALLLKSQPIRSESTGVMNRWKVWRGKGNVAFKVLPALHGLPYVKNLNASVETFATHMVREMLICLDDLERTEIPTKDVLGLVSELKEEKHCKIALVFNPGELKTAEDYRSYKEKVVDLEVAYAPSVEEILNVAIPDNFQERTLISEHVRELGVTNVRILRRIHYICGLVLDVTQAMHEEVRRQAIASVVLFCWCTYGTGESKPDMARIDKWNSELLRHRQQSEAPMSLNEARQAVFLARFGFTHVSDFDLATARVVERGSIEGTGFLEEAAALDASSKREHAAKAFNAMWDRFHRTFGDDMESFISDAYAATSENLADVSVGSLNNTVELFRRVGRSDLADELLDRYVEMRLDHPHIFDLEQHSLGGSLTDPGLRERFSRALVQFGRAPTIPEAFENLMRNGFSRSDISSLQTATEDDFFQFFMRNHASERHMEVVKALVHSETPGVGELAHAALCRVRETNELNALRVEWKFGPNL